MIFHFQASLSERERERDQLKPGMPGQVSKEHGDDLGYKTVLFPHEIAGQHPVGQEYQRWLLFAVNAEPFWCKNEPLCLFDMLLTLRPIVSMHL